MNRALCIWLPEWPIQRLVVAKQARDQTHSDSPRSTGRQREQSRQLEQKPLVLHARDPRRGRLVVACCSTAFSYGVRPKMPLAEVAALEDGSQFTTSSKGDSANLPHGVHRFDLQEHQPELDEQSLEALAIWCEQFSPIVGMEDRGSTQATGEIPSCLLLDITGLGPIFGSEETLVERIHDAFRARGYQIRIGVANTVGAAWAIARFSDMEIVSSTSDAGFAKERIADTVAVREHLGPLPIEALRLPRETVETLRQLGIETIAQLLQLPREALATRLGEFLIKRIDQTLGAQPEVIVAHRPTPQFEADFLFEHPTPRRDAIEVVLQRLTDTVTQALAKNDHAAVQVEAELKGEKITKRLAVSLFQPSSNPQHIFDLLKLQLESSLMREPTKRITVSADTTVRISGEQHVLWDEVGKGRDREVAQLVDRLSSRLGKACVFGVQAQAGALPERAYRKKLLTDTLNSHGNKRRRKLSKQSTAPTLKAPHRPLWLHDPPLPLQMTSVVSRGSRPPAVFQFQNQRHQVAQHWGPERIETGWWSGRSVRRDYYRVETDEGLRFWLFRQLDGGAWFLHGCFE